jgi:cysteine desulfurase
VTTALEHAATAHPCNDLEARGWHVTRLEPGPGGAVDAEEGARVLDTDTALVSVMHANNETGVLQPVRALADAAHAVGAWVHTDAAQSVGKVEVNVDTLGVDLLSLAGHKIYAPKGVGALYVRTGTPLEPLMRGAGHERGLRPGTENVASIVGLGVACALVAQDLGETAARLAALRDRLFAGLAATVPGLVVHGDPALRLSNTLSVRFPGVSGNALLEVTPEVAASTGSACHADDESPSSVLLAMGVPPREALGTVRLSLGRCTTEAEVERAVTALVRGWRLLTGAL